MRKNSKNRAWCGNTELETPSFWLEDCEEFDYEPIFINLDRAYVSF